MIATHYKVQVVETWKGTGASQVEVMLPGGMANGLRQSYAGVPQLSTGKQYVMFLWAGSNGYNQLVGLTQGLFDVSRNSAGSTIASRKVSPELMLDSSGKVVQDQPVSMTMKEMNARVVKVLKARAER